MILSRRVALGGRQLDEIDNRIVIRSVDPGVPHETISASDRMGGAGQRVTSQHWQTLDVNVSYAIDVQKNDMETRKAIFDAVNAWALRKGWLTVNYIPTRRMYVDKVIVPGSGDLWRWTDDYTITFRAYNVPFWQDIDPATATNGNITNGSTPITIPGHVATPLDVAFGNISGMNIPNFSVSAGGKTLTLNGVNIGAGQTLSISHRLDGLLQAYVGSRNVYSLITGSDDLVVNPGDISVTVSATRAGSLRLTAYGRYL